jgi:hypothetical protein
MTWVPSSAVRRLPFASSVEVTVTLLAGPDQLATGSVAAVGKVRWPLPMDGPPLPEC